MRYKLVVSDADTYERVVTRLKESGAVLHVVLQKRRLVSFSQVNSALLEWMGGLNGCELTVESRFDPETDASGDD